MEPGSCPDDLVRMEASANATSLRHYRILELNVGTICASLPSLPALYKHHRLKPARMAAFRTITKKFKPFGSSRTLRDGDRLETGILGSMEGEGKFLASSDLDKITISTGETQISSDGTLK